jgi:hypothetical protein
MHLFSPIYYAYEGLCGENKAFSLEWMIRALFPDKEKIRSYVSTINQNNHNTVKPGTIGPICFQK